MSDDATKILESGVMSEAIASSNMAHTLSSIDGDRPLIYVNQAFLDETGYSWEEVIGKNCRFLQGVGTDPKVVKEIRESLNNFEPLDIELMNYRKDGTPFLNRLRMSTVFDADGKPLAYMGVQSNINSVVEKVRVEQEKYKMESLGRLSGNVSHEIKNALQPIKLMLENLQDSAATMSTEQIERCVEIAMDNMSIAENMVKDVLSFSEHREGSKEKLTAKDLSSLIFRFAQNLMPKTAELNSHSNLGDFELATAEVEQNGILQIVTNLVNNALDATNHKGILSLTTSVTELEPNNSPLLANGLYLIVEFSDDGEGIEEEVLKDIFQPFFSTKSPGKGTGLGLAISAKIAQGHNGALVAENNSDKGVTFSLYLPITI